MDLARMMCLCVSRELKQFEIKEVVMRYTDAEKDLIEAILYFEYRMDKARTELLERHTKRAVTNKLKKRREEREECQCGLSYD